MLKKGFENNLVDYETLKIFIFENFLKHFENVLNGFENGKEKGNKNEKRKPSSPHSFSPSGPALLQAHSSSPFFCLGLSCSPPWPVANFFYFYIIFYSIYQKYMWLYFFFQKCHPAAGWFGGKELPPVHPAVRSLAHGPWKIPPVQTAVAPYHQTNQR